MESKSHAFLAGLFVLVLGAATLAVLYWFGGRREAMRDYVVVTQKSVSGLNSQAQVRYRGIRVGKVNDIRLDPADARNILVAIQVGREVPITRGTVARLGYQGLTGLAYIQLEETGRDPAPLAAAKAGEPPRIAMLPSIFDELGASAPMLLKEVREILAGAKAVLDEPNRQKIAAILNHAEAASSRLQPAIDNVDATLLQVKRLLNDENIRKLAQAAGEAGPLLGETRILVARLQALSGNLDAAVGEPAAGGAAALLPRMYELSADVSAASRQIERVLRLLEESPQSFVFGTPATPPGPGEPGFAPPVP